MKKKSTQNNYLTPAITAICLSMCLAMAQPTFSTGVNDKEVALIEKDPGDKNPVKKAKQVKSKTLVRIYPDILKKVMHVVAKDNEGKEVDFTVFDMKGNLVLNFKMNAGNHEKIAGLTRGTYLYRVFCSDEETATGNFTIR